MNNEDQIDKISDDLTDIKVSMARMIEKLHDTPCAHLLAHISSQSEKIKDLHQKLDTHIETYHSSKNSRANWVAIMTALCALATLATVFYKG